jgi:hypothetical protein
VDRVDEAVEEILTFYRVFHSSRIVGDTLVFRLQRALSETEVRAVQANFEDILKGPADQTGGPLPPEAAEFPTLPRLVLPFNRSAYGRLRQLIDFINSLGGPGPAAPSPPSPGLEQT